MREGEQGQRRCCAVVPPPMPNIASLRRANIFPTCTHRHPHMISSLLPSLPCPARTGTPVRMLYDNDGGVRHVDAHLDNTTGERSR